MFFSARLFQSNFNLIGNTIDKQTPFSYFAIIPYYIWFILLLFVPYYYYKKDKLTLCKYAASYIMCVLIADIIFIAYPTIIERPVVEIKGLLSFMTWFIYWVDNPPINCLPSLHCAISMLYILTAFSSKYVSTRFKVIITILGILVMVSTLVIKQHVLIDLITGDIIMTVCFLIVCNNKYILSKTKKLLKI